MKLFIISTLLALVNLAAAQQSIKFGLLICEHGPVIFRQSTLAGVTFQIKPPSQSQCNAGTVVCNNQFGFFSGHRGLQMCSVSRDCGGGEQVCLRTLSGASSNIEGCCKVGFEAWALSGSQEISGNQNPAAQAGVRFVANSQNEDVNVDN